jgi:hypothetical protein
MRLPLDKFLEKLNVGHTLSPYETQPWFHYAEDVGITCSAEVRMGPTGDDLEAEIQFLYDEIPADLNERTLKGPEKKEGDDDDDSDDRPPKYGGMLSGGRQQILWMQAKPVVHEWSIKLLRIKGKDYVNAFGDWEQKACSFFTACTQALMMGELPDIDALIEEHMKDDDFWGGGRRGRAGKKAPSIKPGQLMGMKK